MLSGDLEESLVAIERFLRASRPAISTWTSWTIMNAQLNTAPAKSRQAPHWRPLQTLIL